MAASWLHIFLGHQQVDPVSSIIEISGTTPATAWLAVHSMKSPEANFTELLSRAAKQSC